MGAMEASGRRREKQELGMLVQICLRALLTFVAKTNIEGPDIDGKRKGVLDAVELVLIASTRVYEHVYAGALDAWVESESSPRVLSLFVSRFRPRLGDVPVQDTGRGPTDSLSRQGIEESLSAASEAASPSGEELPPLLAPDWKMECVIQTLASLFVAQPGNLTAFSQLVPRVFKTHLRLGTEARERLNQILLKNSFDERLGALISQTDDLVGAPFFWNDQVAASSCTSLHHARLLILPRFSAIGRAPPHQAKAASTRDTRR